LTYGLQFQVQEAVRRAEEYLCEAQEPSGYWTDFWLEPGTSDAWVTAFVGLAIVDGCREKAERAAAWLATHSHADGGWGYNRTVPADADSTAFAVALFVRLGIKVPRSAINFLWRHFRSGAGFVTYTFSDSSHRWAWPSVDVTASALVALHQAEELDCQGLQTLWRELLCPAQDISGDWTGFWWEDAAYPTALVLEAWRLAERPPLRFPVKTTGASSPFTAAGRLLAAAAVEKEAEVHRYTSELLASQQSDGSWPGNACLRAPPSHPDRRQWQRTSASVDKRRIFTSALALRALREALPFLADSPAIHLTISPDARSPQRIAADCLFKDVSTMLGFPERALELFQCLTRCTFDGRTSWPAPQLSALSGGFPFEFSVSVSTSDQAKLRYTVDPGDAQLPSCRRAQSALLAASDAVRLFGYESAWKRLGAALRLLLDSFRSTDQWTRFLVWVGADHDGSTQRLILKLYFHLLPRVDFQSILTAAGIPITPDVSCIFGFLSGSGFAQEIGFSIGPDGRIGAKVYWELDGWRRPLVEQVLSRAGFSCGPESLCPEIPLLLRESLAAKSRAGIALRLDPESGAIADVTAAAELIHGMLAPPVIADRLEQWIAANGWNAHPYRRLFAALSNHGELRHTLFTRTLSRSGEKQATIYLRPPATLFY
jgi:hypothetical protein